MTDDLFGGNLTDAPNPHYQKFFDKFKEIDVLPISSWKPVHLIAYFTKKYKETFNKEYTFKFNSSKPTQCFEVFQIKKVSNTLSSKPEIIVPFIDWVFETKIKGKKRSNTSIAFLSHEEVTFEYKTKILAKAKEEVLSRTSLLPTSIKIIFPELSTYGDLSFLSLISPMPKELKEKFESLSKIMDLSSLKKIV